MKFFFRRFTLLLKHVKELLGLPDTHGDSQQSDDKHRRRQAHTNDDMELEHKIGDFKARFEKSELSFKITMYELDLSLTL